MKTISGIQVGVGQTIVVLSAEEVKIAIHNHCGASGYADIQHVIVDRQGGATVIATTPPGVEDG